jgi:hypothetical protein
MEKSFIIECKKCGAPIEVKDNSKVVVCEYCQSANSVPVFESTDEINRADHLRRSGEFDRALALFEQVFLKNPEDYEAYWGYILAKFGVEYVDDPKTGKKIPTLNRMHPSLFTNNSEYKKAVEYAPTEIRALYEKEGAEIDEIQRKVWEISKTQEDFDIFLCYKENDDFGERTKDSIKTEEIYELLTKEGYKVFFAKKTLEGYAGQEYEPLIYAALHSAKVMLVITSNEDYLNAVWVKNEWARYLNILAKEQDKYLIPCLMDGMIPEQLPQELAKFQAINLAKVGSDFDVKESIEKIFGDQQGKNAILSQMIREREEKERKKQEEEAEKQKKILERKEKQEKQKRFYEKHKKVIIVSTCTIVVVFIFGIVFSNYYKTTLGPKLKYDKAVQSYESGDYEKAYQLFGTMLEYEDSSHLQKAALYSLVSEKIENGEYEGVSDLIFQVKKEYSSDAALQLDYQLGLATYENTEDFAEYGLPALKTVVDSYEKSNDEDDKSTGTNVESIDADKVKYSNYLIGTYYIGLEKYSDGIKYLTNCADYKDSADLITDATYNAGINAAKLGSDATAIEYFNSVKDYKDSAEQILNVKYTALTEKVNQVTDGIYDSKIKQYAKDLAEVNYKDSKSIYTQINKWKATLTCEKSLQMGTMQGVDFECKILNAPLDTSTKITFKISCSDGSSYSYTTDDSYFQGQTGGSSLSNNNGSLFDQTFTCYAYASDGTLLASFSGKAADFNF